VRRPGRTPPARCAATAAWLAVRLRRPPAASAPWRRPLPAFRLHRHPVRHRQPAALRRQRVAGVCQAGCRRVLCKWRGRARTARRRIDHD
jgi:hypothetical protein